MKCEKPSLDINYDFRTDSGGKDPDFASPTLKKFHKLLWNKKLPNGEMLSLIDKLPNHYLLGITDSMEVSLSSDTLCNSYSKRKRMQPLLEPISSLMEQFKKDLYSIGGFILFPSKRINGFNTINQARGWIKTIDDRFDLTLECIRLYYRNRQSPLYPTLNRYRNFFSLFVDFEKYVKFFLLEDLVSKDFNQVRFFILHSKTFDGNALPKNTEDYFEFITNAQSFLQSRNQRILDWANKNI